MGGVPPWPLAEVAVATSGSTMALHSLAGACRGGHWCSHLPPTMHCLSGKHAQSGGAMAQSGAACAPPCTPYTSPLVQIEVRSRTGVSNIFQRGTRMIQLRSKTGRRQDPATSIFPLTPVGRSSPLAEAPGARLWHGTESLLLPNDVEQRCNDTAACLAQLPHTGAVVTCSCHWTDNAIL